MSPLEPQQVVSPLYPQQREPYVPTTVQAKQASMQAKQATKASDQAKQATQASALSLNCCDRIFSHRLGCSME